MKKYLISVMMMCCLGMTACGQAGWPGKDKEDEYGNPLPEPAPEEEKAPEAEDMEFIGMSKD